VVLDVSIVTVAIPTIGKALQFTPANLQWIISAYALTFAGFLLVGGRAADVFGPRRVLTAGLALFVVASAFAGAAHSEGVLIAARAAQGLGAAMVSPTTLALLTRTFTEPDRRARAIGIWTATAGAAGASGSLVGGLLVQTLSWRWIFLINVPIGIACIGVAFRVIEGRASRSRERDLDVVGAILATVATTGFVYGLVRTTDLGWRSPDVIGLLVASTGLFGSFVFHERRRKTDQLLPMNLFRVRPLWSANLATLALAAAMAPMPFFVSLYLQRVLGYSALGAGLTFLPHTIALVLGAQVSSRLLFKTQPRLLLLGGIAMCTVGLLWLGTLGPSSEYWTTLFVPSVVTGFGLGLSFAPIAFAAISHVYNGDVGVASGLINTSRQLGGTIGLAVLTTIAVTRANELALSGSAHPHVDGVALLPVRAITGGYALALSVAAGFAFLSAWPALYITEDASSAPFAEPTTSEAATESGA
jgi:EmrB/QacA subfamily drug resistance transporter